MGKLVGQLQLQIPLSRIDTNYTLMHTLQDGYMQEIGYTHEI